MRFVRPSDFRHPVLYGVGVGASLASLVLLFACLLSGNISQLPIAVRFAPGAGFLIATVFMLLGGYRNPSDREASR